ncbi:MAG: YraN family protein [Butyrivibrio sp.]|nr:YraN family protein [Butyrivibrio sp.]
MNKREAGDYYETLACDYLRENGLKIIQKNFRCRQGEIDIIARDGKYLVFTEVKFRKGNRFGTAEAAVDYKKQNVISRVSDFYRKRFGISDDTCQRFDVVALDLDDDEALHIRWHKNAFLYVPKRNTFY